MLKLNGEELARRVREAMDNAKPPVTSAAVAKACEVTPQAVNGWRKNGRVHKRHLSKLVQLTGRPLTYFLEDAENSESSFYREVDSARPESIPLDERVPMVGTAEAGDDGYWDELQYPAGYGEGFVRYPTRDPNTYAIRIKGDSMRPRVKPGEFLIVEPNSPLVPGEEVMVTTHDGRSMVKVLGRRHDGVVEFHSINEDHPPFSLEESIIRSMHYVAAIMKSGRYYRDV